MSSANPQLGVLFVCLGNICRSPTAEGVFRKKLSDAGLSSQVRVDSAGTGAWHVGNPPDRRAQAAATKRGIDLSMLRARQVAAQDFAQFDYILAMDEENRSSLIQQCPAGVPTRIALLLDFLPDPLPEPLPGSMHSHAQTPAVREVPDPYYGEGDGFELVLDLVEAACDGLIAEIRRKASLTESDS